MGLKVLNFELWTLTCKAGVTIRHEGEPWGAGTVVTPGGVDTGVAALRLPRAGAAGVTAGEGGASIGQVALIQIWYKRNVESFIWIWNNSHCIFSACNVYISFISSLWLSQIYTALVQFSFAISSCSIALHNSTIIVMNGSIEKKDQIWRTGNKAMRIHRFICDLKCCILYFIIIKT